MRKTVLLIEDDLPIRENTAEMLEINGYTVVTARNGKEGFHLIREKKVDVILCDILMPEMDGMTLFEQLSRHSDTKAIPFIFLTAMTEPEEINRGMEKGASGYLTKPFTEEHLMQAITRCTSC